jgi:hypothetical protein
MTAQRDQNYVPTLQGVSSIDLETPTNISVDPVTGAVLAEVTTQSYAATSTTELTIGTGSKTLTTQDGKPYANGTRLRIASDSNPSNYMEGIVTSYSGTSLTINVDNTGGSGTYSDWNINLSGDKGDQGDKGDKGDKGDQGDKGLNWKGAWSNTTSYVIDDAVEHSGSSYVCIQANTNQEPPNPTYWQMLAQKGEDISGGDVVGPTSSTNNNFASFDGATGKLIKDSGYSPSDFDPAGTASSLVSSHASQTSTHGVTGNIVGTSDTQELTNKSFGNPIAVDTINEKTTDNGVTVDGVKLKDEQVYTDTINEKTANAGVTIDGVLLKDQTITLTQQSSTPPTPASGKNTIFVDTSGNQYILDSSGNKFYIVSESLGGWMPANETWTYASADSPTFTFTVAGDKTSKYSPGMRIKLTQSGTVKYFIITAVSYSAPNTTITVYGGTDYTLANATISNNYYSFHKAPVGFPLDPTKWTVRYSSNSNAEQISPAQNQWYNLGSASITIPIGLWNVRFVNAIGGYKNTNDILYFSTALSIQNNSASDTDLLCSSGASHNTNHQSAFIQSAQKVLNLSNKTTYYLNNLTDTSGLMTLYRNATSTKTIIEAVCAYL